MTLENNWIIPKELPPTLSRYGTDLTLQVYNGLLHPSERDDAAETRLLQILSRRRKRSPALLGNDSQFEQRIIEGLAIRIAKENADKFSNVQIIGLEVEHLLSHNQARMEFNKIVDEIRASVRPIVLYIKDIHRLINYPDKDLFNRDFRFALRLGHVQFICSTTLEIYRATIEVDGALSRSFAIFDLTL